MQVFLNGEFVPEEKAVVPISDRSFLYGDGIFETLRLTGGRPFRWEAHWQRLQHGARILRIALPMEGTQARAVAEELSTQNRLPDAVLRITLSRGSGPRGYSPREATRPVFVMALSPALAVDPDRPHRWRLATASGRVQADDPLVGIKSNNKLTCVLARAEAEGADADEALLLNTAGEVAEAASGNIFWIADGVVITPPLDCGALGGVTRAAVLELCVTLALPIAQRRTPVAGLVDSEGVFLTLSTLGLVEVISVDRKDVRSSRITSRLSRAYWDLVRREAVPTETRL